jgi:hypothetical protein
LVVADRAVFHVFPSGGGVWAYESSSVDQPTLKTMPGMNKCMLFIRLKLQRNRHGILLPNSAVLTAGVPVIINFGHTMLCDYRHLPQNTVSVHALCPRDCRFGLIRPHRLSVALLPTAGFFGTDASDLSEELSVIN